MRQMKREPFELWVFLIDKIPNKSNISLSHYIKIQIVNNGCPNLLKYPLPTLVIPKSDHPPPP